MEPVGAAVEGALQLASKETFAEDGGAFGKEAALCTRSWFVGDGFEGKRLGEEASVVAGHRAGTRGSYVQARSGGDARRSRV